jgi:hypothetical protein
MGRICVLADSGKYLPSGSERDPHVLQILIGQMGEYGNVNLILGKTLGVCPRPSFSSQSAICCIAATKRISHR